MMFSRGLMSDPRINECRKIHVTFINYRIVTVAMKFAVELYTLRNYGAIEFTSHVSYIS